MRHTLAIGGVITLFLGLLGLVTPGILGGLFAFEPVETMFRLFFGAILATAGMVGTPTLIGQWTRATGLTFCLMGFFGLAFPNFLGIHFEPAENLLSLGLGVACLVGGRARRSNPAEQVIPPGPPEVETGEEYKPGPVPPKAMGTAVPADVTVTDQMLQEAARDTTNWLTYYHDYAGHCYVPDTEITPTNVKGLVPKWIYQTGVLEGFETTPLVVNGVMYITTANGPDVIALDAATGSPIWRYSYPRPKGIGLCCGPVNRGVALGGGRLFFASLDARLVCLDARTGDLLWYSETGDPRKGESQTQAPLYYKGRVLVGLSGSEFNAKGRMHCFDAATGKLLWVFETVADFGWGKGDPRLYGGGCPWITGVIDTETDTLFFGTGNPSPDFDDSVRPGDNPYTDSIIALDVRTGKMKWYYQVTPHDLWDYDSAAPIFLYTAVIAGKTVKAVGHADKNGYFYALDRGTGKLLFRSVEFVEHRNFGVRPTKEGVVFCPGVSGGTEWPPSACHPDLGLTYISAIHGCARISSRPWAHVPGRSYWGGAFTQLVGDAYGSLVAMDVNTGQIRWRHRTNLPLIGGTLVTGKLDAGGSLVFTGEQDGYFDAFDAQTGKVLWRFQCGAGVHAPPISYRAAGRQFIALAVGNGGAAKAIGVHEIGGQRVPGGRMGDTVIAFGLLAE